MHDASDYRDRLRRLVETKLAQTAEKRQRFGHWDEDDLGYVPPPADWKWEPTPNHPNGGFYGLEGWSSNFASIMAAHPVYIDPDDALAGRWMAFLNRSRKGGWKPEFPFPHLAGEIAMYGINPGIGGENHFAADFQLGLELGWGGILKKIRHYRIVHGPEKAAFYDAHEKVVLAIQDWIRRHVEQIRSMGVPPMSSTGILPVSNMGVSPMPDGGASLENRGIEKREGAHLPHWTRQGATYSVTFRLFDSLPKSVLEAWLSERDGILLRARKQNRELTRFEARELNELFSARVDSYLNAGRGACYMKAAPIAGLVQDAVKHFDGQRYDLAAWAVMPNHVHVVVHPRDGHPLEEILHSWKSFTAKQANRLLAREGQFWQEEYYDHLIRDEDDFINAVNYVLDNPARAGLANWEWLGCNQDVRAKLYERNDEEHGQDARATHGQDARATNLAEMLDCNQHLIDNPPRTLREACQWIAWYNMIGRIYGRDGAGCQLDEILRPYYERDLAAGLIDDETAIFYIACLLLNETHYYQISGPAPDGRDLTSKVSYLVLEAAHRLGIANNLTVRVCSGSTGVSSLRDGTPVLRGNKQFFLTAVGHLMRDRKGWPRFAGDKGLTEGFMRNGYPAELARQRIAVGCHWFVIPGREYTLNDIVKINVAKVFEVAFYDMIEDPTAKPSVAELWRRYEFHLRRAVAVTAKAIDFHLAHQKDNTPELTLNLLCHGTLEKGLDASDGGVEFYNMCVDGSGLATTADAFAALEQRIEKEGVLTWEQIAGAIRTDWAGTDGERIRQMMLHSSRYGQDNAWAVKVSRAFTAAVKEHNTPGGRNMIPGWFSWSATIRMGELVGATPDGRRAKSPISHGANPNNGFRSDGAATAMATAIAAVQTGYGNTCPIQLELSPGFAADEEGIARIASLIKTHFDQGGTLFNINIIDKDKLLAAHKDPAAFPDLIVRVTGFTAYFAVLSPAFRQLVVDRLIES